MAYTPDRFDDVPEYTDQRGSHREHYAPVAAGGSLLKPLMIAAALAVLIGLFVGVVLPSMQKDDAPTASSSESSASSDEKALSLIHI